MKSQVENLRSQYPIKPYQGIYDIVLSYSVIVSVIFLCHFVSYWFYPLACLLIANRFLALSLVGHEALHGNLMPSMRWNNFYGRYFCCFPCLISFQKYQRIHTLHHRTLGSKLFDPDRHLYDFFPEKKWVFLRNLTRSVFSGKLAWSFLNYYTEIPDLMAKKKDPSGELFGLNSKSDLISLVAFWIVIILLINFFHVGFEFTLFFLIPIFLVMQPYVIFMGALQHGPLDESQAQMKLSRSIVEPELFLWLLLPLDINFHGEHHLSPFIPHYWLKKYSLQLREQGHDLWHESYSTAVKNLLT